MGLNSLSHINVLWVRNIITKKLFLNICIIVGKILSLRPWNIWAAMVIIRLVVGQHGQGEHLLLVLLQQVDPAGHLL